MLSKFLSTAALAIVVAASSAQAQNISRQIPVDSGFFETYVQYSGQPRAYSMMIKLITVGGKLELCGVGAYKSVQYRSNITRGLRGTKFMVNGRPVIKGMDFFSQVNRAKDMKSSKANCRATGVKTPRKIEDIDIDWGNFTAR